MKSAMQELIDRLSPEQNGIKLIAESLLEKEKEQIMDAYGTAICMFYESEQPEEYYNQTYNQNK